MMDKTYAQVVDGKVVNLLLWDGLIAERPDDFPPNDEWAPFPAGLAGTLVEATDGVALGATYVGGKFVNPEPPQALPAPVPREVTMRQARLALLASSLLDDVEAAVDATGDPAARIEWDYAATVERASPFTQQLAAALGLSDSALDELFTQAAAL